MRGWAAVIAAALVIAVVVWLSGDRDVSNAESVHDMRSDAAATTRSDKSGRQSLPSLHVESGGHDADASVFHPDVKILIGSTYRLAAREWAAGGATREELIAVYNAFANASAAMRHYAVQHRIEIGHLTLTDNHTLGYSNAVAQQVYASLKDRVRPEPLDTLYYIFKKAFPILIAAGGGYGGPVPDLGSSNSYEDLFTFDLSVYPPKRVSQ